MIYKNTTTWQAERVAMILKTAGLPLDPSSGEVGHIDNHAVVHELLAEYIFDLENDSQIWKKTADNEWSGIDTAPSYDDSGLQDYLQETEEFYIQSFGKSPMFYLVADRGWEQKEYTHPSEMPVGSTLYSGQKGLIGAVNGLALESDQLRQRVEILDDENHTRRDEIVALTARIEALENPTSPE